MQWVAMSFHWIHDSSQTANFLRCSSKSRRSVWMISLINETLFKDIDEGRPFVKKKVGSHRNVSWRRAGIAVFFGLLCTGTCTQGEQAQLHLTHISSKTFLVYVGDIYLCQHLLRQRLAAWRHQAIAWTNADLQSQGICGAQLVTTSKGSG